MRTDSIVPMVLVLNDEYWLPYALSCIKGHFSRYVLYDVGSTDRTREILEWFVEEERGEADIFTRFLDKIPEPEAQGAFRNSMMAEARCDWTLMVDGDELYPPYHIETIKNIPWQVINDRLGPRTRYGVVSRIEVGPDLDKIYNNIRTHHRIYHRTAIFTGTHPGEVPFYKQKTANEIDIPAVCYHFHNTLRSSKEEEALKRIKRKSQKTYHPGQLMPANLLERLPILRKPIEDFKPNPVLERLQDAVV